MGLILDTSILIAAERGRFDLAALYRAHARERFHLAAITVAELAHGVERADTPARKTARAALVEQFFAHLEILEYDATVARRHAAIWAGLEKKGKMIGPYDLLIAATALAHGYGLVTLNGGEFHRVPSLVLVDVRPFAAK